jgi:hypothetical protein
MDGLDRTIDGASPTFHTPVPIDDMGFLTVHLEYAVGAYDFAHTTAHTNGFIELERCNI